MTVFSYGELMCEVSQCGYCLFLLFKRGGKKKKPVAIISKTAFLTSGIIGLVEGGKNRK